MIFDALLLQQMRVVAVAGPGQHLEVREMLARHLGGAHRSFDAIDRQHQELGLLGLGGSEEFQARGIAVIHLAAEAAQGLDLVGIRFQRGEGYLLHAQQAAHDLAEAAHARDDHWVARARRCGRTPVPCVPP